MARQAAAQAAAARRSYGLRAACAAREVLNCCFPAHTKSVCWQPSQATRPAGPDYRRSAHPLAPSSARSRLARPAAAAAPQQERSPSMEAPRPR